jgi:hypothetical protein
MLSLHFFERYDKFIHFKNLVAEIKKLNGEGKIDTVFQHEISFRRKINGGLANFTVNQLKDLSYVLRESGIQGGQQAISGKQLKSNPIIKTKPFVEFALVDRATWDHIIRGEPLTNSEKQARREIEAICQQIYQGITQPVRIQKKLAGAMNDIASDL